MGVGHVEITQLIIDCSFSMRNPVGNCIDCATPTTPSPAQMASDPQDYEWEMCLLQILLLTLMCLYGEYYPSVRCIMLCQTASIQGMQAGQIKDLNIEMQDKSKTPIQGGCRQGKSKTSHIRLVLLAPSVPLFLSVPRSWHICWWINLTTQWCLIWFLKIRFGGMLATLGDIRAWM